jgi:hypothetical protein
MLRDVTLYFLLALIFPLIPVAARSRAWVCGRPLAGIAGTNPAWSVDVCLVSVVCCEVEFSGTS